MAQLERCGRHRRGRRPGHRQSSNTAAGSPKPSPRGTPPANRRDRRPARNAHPERNARIAQLDLGRRHRRGARPGHRQRPNAAAGFPHAVAARAVAREPSRPPPRAEHPARAQCAHCAARRRPPPPSRPPTRSPPALEHRRRFSPSPRRAGRRLRTVATAAPRGPPSQGAVHAMRDSTSAAATVAAPALATAGARSPPPICPRSRRDGPARYFGRAPAHRGTPGQVRRSRCARSPMVAATVAAPTPAPLRLPQRSRSSLRPRTVAPSTESAHRGRFPT